MDGGHRGVALALHLAARSHKGCGEVAVAMTHGERSLSRGVQAVCRISIHSAIRSHLEVLQVTVVQLSAEIEILSRFAILDIEYERHTLGIHRYLFCHRWHSDGHE